MKGFIEVDANGKLASIQVAHIISLRTGGSDLTYLILINSDEVKVRLSYDVVKVLIEKATV